MLKTLLTFLSIVFTAGCVSIESVSSFPEGSLSENNVTIMRGYNFVGGGVHYWPRVDGQIVAGIFGRQYVSFQLKPGQYLLDLRWSNALEVEIKENEKRYFLLTPSLFHSEIEEINKLEAEERLQIYHRIPTGYVSDCQGVAIAFKDSKDRLCFSRAIP